MDSKQFISPRSVTPDGQVVVRAGMRQCTHQRQSSVVVEVRYRVRTPGTNRIARKPGSFRETRRDTSAAVFATRSTANATQTRNLSEYRYDGYGGDLPAYWLCDHSPSVLASRIRLPRTTYDHRSHRPCPTDETSEYSAGKRAFAGGEQYQIHTSAVLVAGITLAADVVEGAAHCAQNAPDHDSRECAASGAARSPRDHGVRDLR
jgi:hypothetical protein